jgi:septum formation protein
MIFNTHILLASKSPRRAEILKNAGLPYTIINLNCDENYPKNTAAADVAQYIAVKKMKAIEININKNQIVLTADTVVVLDNKIYEKAGNLAEAKKMLLELSGRVHTVMTGVCIKTLTQTIEFTEKSEVQFRILSNEAIDYYLANFNVLDKAGAYGIQEGIGLYAVERIAGCYFNVMGLPINQILKNLEHRL